MRKHKKTAKQRRTTRKRGGTTSKEERIAELKSRIRNRMATMKSKKEHVANIRSRLDTRFVDFKLQNERSKIPANEPVTKPSSIIASGVQPGYVDDYWRHPRGSERYNRGLKLAVDRAMSRFQEYTPEFRMNILAELREKSKEYTGMEYYPATAKQLEEYMIERGEL